MKITTGREVSLKGLFNRGERAVCYNLSSLRVDELGALHCASVARAYQGIRWLCLHREHAIGDAENVPWYKLPRSFWLVRTDGDASLLRECLRAIDEYLHGDGECPVDGHSVIRVVKSSRSNARKSKES